MKKILFGIFLILCCLIQQAKAANNDYLNEVNAHKLFGNNNIKVWVQNGTQQGTVYTAFLEWERASGNCIKFRLANSEKTAQIKVYFVNQKINPNTQRSVAVGYTTYSATPVIQIITINPFTGKYFTQRQIFGIAVHEIGHALGIMGHSSNPNDIMYHATIPNSIFASNRDYNTIRKLYCK